MIDSEAIKRLILSLTPPIDSGKETLMQLYGDVTPEQDARVTDWLKEYVRDETRDVPLSEVEQMLFDVFNIESPVLKTYTARKTGLQPVYCNVVVKAFDEDEADDLIRNNEDDDWTVDPHAEVQDVEIEDVREY